MITIFRLNRKQPGSLLPIAVRPFQACAFPDAGVLRHGKPRFRLLPGVPYPIRSIRTEGFDDIPSASTTSWDSAAVCVL